MSKPRLYLAPERWQEPVGLEPEELHRLLEVLRLRAGAELEVFDGRGRAAVARLQESDRGWVLQLLGPAESNPALPRVRLAVALTKARKLDLVVRMATEVGVSSIEPFLSARSVARPPAARLGNRRQRWQAIIREAARQSGRSELPQLGSLCSLEQLLAEPLPAASFLLHPEAPQQFARALAGHAAATRLVLVGPEGGFAPGEIELAAARGVQPVSLPLPVLRAETAAVVAAALACLW